MLLKRRYLRYKKLSYIDNRVKQTLNETVLISEIKRDIEEIQKDLDSSTASQKTIQADLKAVDGKLDDLLFAFIGRE